MENVVYLEQTRKSDLDALNLALWIHYPDVQRLSGQMKRLVRDLLKTLETVNRIIDTLTDQELKDSLRGRAERSREALLESMHVLSLEIERLSAVSQRVGSQTIGKMN
jgi:hypothetical protein